MGFGVRGPGDGGSSPEMVARACVAYGVPMQEAGIGRSSCAAFQGWATIP